MTSDQLSRVFATNLRRRRQELGLSQTALAKRMGVAQTYISDLEAGKKMPLIGTLAGIGNALNLSPDLLLRDFSEISLSGVA